MGFLDFLFGDGRNQGRGTAVRGTAEAHGREVWASGTMDDGTYWEKGGRCATPHSSTIHQPPRRRQRLR
ncbi:hypothetical protein COT69_02210 [candidate division WWE3 bacterium CG09_land_8_20_14_0_10_39_24]|uniref:Uncharacterized protein n=1 Tax=candidate division WWE3 bacterium CG09_land_8_20_14_0_10_39_24 TaxID=1975088 RepID=A0A2H0WJD9_UNCKA|nr:MAG: hypothetical protein COT69_02210 [candidate division WWE3 bacterium CG09_land_8_20_14_0_10_39_24]PJE51654.1 MAG: hypothetical protein COV27_01815 [candidate division WWE3 bacterium CG10_big_fil_rev_8_21_14_0_10_39_14]